MIDTSAILLGEYDKDLDAIVAACQQRRKLVRSATAAVTMAAIEVGDTVRIKDIRPKYLVGATAVVRHKRQTRLEIRLNEDSGRYHAGQYVTIPSSCVEVV